LDKENAVLIGTAIDELIRHHPSLKTPVFEAIKATLSKIEELGKAFVVPSSQQHWYNLVPVQTSSDSDVPMEDLEGSSHTTGEMTIEQDNEDEDIADRSHDNEVVGYIDIIGRVSISCNELELAFTLPSSWKACFSIVRIVGTLSLQLTVLLNWVG
jgi:E3 ubiquitin-protein ligase HUWE1